MKIATALIGLAALTGCTLVIDAEEADRIKQCQQLPTVDERQTCERAASDALDDRYYNEQRGMIETDRYTLPKDVCPVEDDDACDFD